MFVNTNSVSLVIMLPPTLIQDTIGEGIPEALHNTVRFPPSVIFTFCIGCMDEGTANKYNKLLVNVQ